MLGCRRKGEISVKIIAQNKKAYFDYYVEEKYEAGIELYGTEVKSVRLGQINLKDSYCSIDKGQIFALGVHISPYEKGNIFNKDPLRPKRLLMHKKEILKLFGQVRQAGYSIIPLSVYLKGPLMKMEIGLCKGKKLYDKRESIAKRDADREIGRRMRERN
ncbi:MAG: SsrA-binding protein SmpB [Clostridiales bacterium]|nr:SsrA-binding protein SmpB [Clostridiales bacterium]